MQGMDLAVQGHIVNVLPPQDVSGGAVGDRFKMSHHGKATIVVKIGVSAAAPTAILVKEADAASGGTATAIPFSYYAEETDAGDTLGTRQAATAAGITPSANNNIMYVIDLDARELSEDTKWVEVSITNASGNSVLADITAILTGARYSFDPGDSVLA